LAGGIYPHKVVTNTASSPEKHSYGLPGGNMADVGEWPRFLLTDGTVDKEPQIDFSSLCAAKVASQTLNRLFAQALPQASRL
jgi:hypothetical protein